MPTDLLGIDFVDPRHKPKHYKNGKEEKVNKVVRFQQTAFSCYTQYFSYIVRFLVFLAFIGFTIYFICSLVYSVDNAEVLIILTCISVVLFVYTRIRNRFGDRIYRNIYMPVRAVHRKTWHCTKW